MNHLWRDSFFNFISALFNCIFYSLILNEFNFLCLPHTSPTALSLISSRHLHPSHPTELGHIPVQLPPWSISCFLCGVLSFLTFAASLFSSFFTSPVSISTLVYVSLQKNVLSLSNLFIGERLTYRKTDEEIRRIKGCTPISLCRLPFFFESLRQCDANILNSNYW